MRLSAFHFLYARNISTAQCFNLDLSIDLQNDNELLGDCHANSAASFKVAALYVSERLSALQFYMLLGSHGGQFFSFPRLLAYESQDLEQWRKLDC